MIEAPDVHGPLDQYEALSVRRRFGFTKDLGRRYSCRAWGKKGTTKVLYLPIHQEIEAHSFIFALEEVGISATEYYEAVRAIRAPRSR